MRTKSVIQLVIRYGTAVAARQPPRQPETGAGVTRGTPTTTNSVVSLRPLPSDHAPSSICSFFRLRFMCLNFGGALLSTDGFMDRIFSLRPAAQTRQPHTITHPSANVVVPARPTNAVCPAPHAQHCTRHHTHLWILARISSSFLNSSLLALGSALRARYMPPVSTEQSTRSLAALRVSRFEGLKPAGTRVAVYRRDRHVANSASELSIGCRVIRWFGHGLDECHQHRRRRCSRP